MKVYIIRHGEVPHNALKQYNNENEDLTKKGIKQAEELREKIKTIDYDIVICSPLIRAKHTAKIINVKEKEIIIFNSHFIVRVFFCLFLHIIIQRYKVII